MSRTPCNKSSGEFSSFSNRDKQAGRRRIIMADDNPEILDCVHDMLRTNYEIIARISDGDSVCAAVRSLAPDLVLLDISMGDRSGIEIARQLRGQGYTGQIVFLTVHEDLDFVNAAIGAGGRGYVIKSRMTLDLAPAIRAALTNRVFISPSLHRG